MPNWFLYATATVLLWGVWGVLLKMGVDRLGPQTTWLVHSCAFFGWVMLYKLVSGFKLTTETQGLLIVVVAALFASSGGLLLLTALSRGTASAVLPLVALYPAVVVLLGFLFLKESLTPSRWRRVKWRLFVREKEGRDGGVRAELTGTMGLAGFDVLRPSESGAPGGAKAPPGEKNATRGIKRIAAGID